MNRRKAIGGLLVGLGGVVGITGYKWYDWNKAPDLAYLDHQKDLLAALAETIIPATDTPGAKESGVAEYILRMMKDCTELKSQNHFIDGLKELQAFARVHYNKTYMDCSPAQQQTIMATFEKAGRPLPGILGKAQARYTGQSFFITLREYTVRGYCTSRQGATNALAYLPVPGSYKGITTLQPGQKSWATK